MYDPVFFIEYFYPCTMIYYIINNEWPKWSTEKNKTITQIIKLLIITSLSLVI